MLLKTSSAWRAPHLIPAARARQAPRQPRRVPQALPPCRALQQFQGVPRAPLPAPGTTAAPGEPHGHRCPLCLCPAVCQLPRASIKMPIPSQHSPLQSCFSEQRSLSLQICPPTPVTISSLQVWPCSFPSCSCPFAVPIPWQVQEGRGLS